MIKKQNIILFNNKEILVGGKQIFWSEWFKKGIISIKDLLDETANLLTFQAFSLKPVFYNTIKCSEAFLSTWILPIAKFPITVNQSINQSVILTRYV